VTSDSGAGAVRRRLAARWTPVQAAVGAAATPHKIKTWGLAVAKRTSHRKATVAVARKLAVVMHAMWVDGTFYCGDPAPRAADVSARAAAKDKKLLGAYA
jgi:transposase